MAIKVSQAFERTSAAPIDSSIALTKAQMLAVNDNLMPAYYFTISQDDGKIYLYDKTATASPTTGKFTEFSGGSGTGGSEVFLTTATLDTDINDTTTVLAADLSGVDFADITIGVTLIRDDKGTMGLVTAKNGTTDVTVTTATTSTPTKELTQAEYDALTEAEKKNGTIYFITDNYVGSTYVGALESIYSTTERVIGSYMGKPLYQRTWKSSTVQVISNSGWGQQFSIPKAGMEQIVKCLGNGNSSIGGQAWQFMANLDSSATYVSFLAARDGDTVGATEVTLQYTKTTDTTSPVEYASPNDYSTSEKIVGTWIDGKPLYQKTLIFENVSSETDKNIAHNLANVGVIFLVDGVYTLSGTNYTIYNAAIENGTLAANLSYSVIINYIDSSKIRCQIGSNRGGGDLYITLRYTKTTD